MQAVILAAGRGTRMGDLTKDRPKPMIELGGKTLLERKFDVLPADVDEVILIVGYLGEVIRDRFGDSYKGKKLTYVTQENPVGGTADALWKAKSILKGKFFVLNGDDLYTKEDLEAMRASEWSVLVQRVPDTTGAGKVVFDRERRVIDIIEGAYHGGGEGAVNTASYVLDTRIFDFPQVPKAAGSTELGLPQTILAASKSGNIPFTAVEATGWVQLKNPDALARAETMLSHVR
jgi:bifunctional UDP-N-acetylglucosamine pyrophosphorylase/glucosamine-1-phosphate N-acetyltransferase